MKKNNALINLEESMIIGTPLKSNKIIKLALFGLKLFLAVSIVVLGSIVISNGVNYIYKEAKQKINMAVIDLKNRYGIVKYEVVDTQSTENIQTLVSHYSSKYGIS